MRARGAPGARDADTRASTVALGTHLEHEVPKTLKTKSALPPPQHSSKHTMCHTQHTAPHFRAHVPGVQQQCSHSQDPSPPHVALAQMIPMPMGQGIMGRGSYLERGARTNDEIGDEAVGVLLRVRRARPQQRRARRMFAHQRVGRALGLAQLQLDEESLERSL